MILSFSFVLYCGILMMMSISGWCIALELIVFRTE